jgi:peptidoglycan/LPS O-acetylase OafA/YrhL
MNSHKKDLPALTGLRFVAAFMVLIAHSASVLPTGSLPKFLIGLAPPGMALFFVLSGFVIWLNYAQPIADGRRGALRDFAIARFARLYPMYLVVLLLGLAITSAVSGIGEVKKSFPQILYFASFLDAWFPDYNGRLVVSVTYITHLWSISTEVFFYVVFPLIAVLLVKAKSLTTVTMIGFANIVLAGVALYFVIEHSYEIMSIIAPRLTNIEGWYWLLYYSPYMRLFQFISGCLACHLYLTLQYRSPTRLETCRAGLLAYLAGIALLAMTVIGNFSDLTVYRMTCALLLQIIPLVALSFLMFFVSRYSSGLSHVLSLRPLVIGGEASYSIYLLHPFVLVGIEGTGRLLPSQIVPQLAFLGVTALAVGLISHATYRLIERPAKNWLRQKLREWPRSDHQRLTTPMAGIGNRGWTGKLVSGGAISRYIGQKLPQRSPLIRLLSFQMMAGPVAAVGLRARANLRARERFGRARAGTAAR